MIDMNKVPGYKTGSPTVGQQTLGATAGGFAPQPLAKPAAQPQAAAAPPPQTPTATQGGPGYNLGFQTPQQFNQAGQIYTQLGQGRYYIPQQIQQGSQAANQMLQQGGNPTSTAAYQQAAMPVLQKQMEDIRKQAMASANVSGMGNSSVLGNQIAQGQGDLMNQFNMGLANQQLGLDEAAKSRMLQAMGMLGNYGGQELQADQFGQNMAMQAAGGLQGLGSQYWNMPFQMSGAMAGLGNQYNQAGLRPEDQMYAQMLGLGAQASGQQQYTPGFGTQVAQFLGGASQYIPGIMSGLGIGGNPSAGMSSPSSFSLPNLSTGFSLSPYTGGGLNLSPYQNPYQNPFGVNFSLTGK